jgi:3-oxoacyl-[acyl-carrier protein] reductase
MLTRVLAKELEGTGVTANCLYPSMVDTDMQSDVRSVDTSESRLDFTAWHESYEQGQLTSPENAARLIYWLVGPWGRRHNGVIFQSTDQAWVQQVSADLGE